VTVLGFSIDERTEAHLEAHDVLVEALSEVLEGEHRIRRNKRNRRATHVITGFDRHGYCLAICIEPTHDPVIWIPVTAWYPDTAHQKAWCP